MTFEEWYEKHYGYEPTEENLAIQCKGGDDFSISEIEDAYQGGKQDAYKKDKIYYKDLSGVKAIKSYYKYQKRVKTQFNDLIDFMVRNYGNNDLILHIDILLMQSYLVNQFKILEELNKKVIK
jgi:hypothetical protein